MSIILAVIKLVIILCIVATVHEIGHFVAAKLLKIGVNEFSIGFGPKIIQRKYKETMYSLRYIPLGGYVMIEGEGEESDKPNSFNKKNALEKIIVLTMGVIFNIILAFIILITTSFTMPTYTTQILELSNISVLNEVGILPGDKITKVNGDKVTLASDLFNDKYSNVNSTEIEYLRDNQIKNVNLTNAVKEIGYIGVGFQSNPLEEPNRIDSVRPGKPADKSGIKPGDLIVQINDISVDNSAEIINIIKGNPLKELTLKVNREGEILTKNITPELIKQFDLGIIDVKEEKTNLNYAFIGAINIIKTVFNSYADLFKGKLVLDDVSSIVGIGVVVSKTTSLIDYLNTLAIISLAIGMANILPFPPLDGGKIIFVLLASITRKKIPVNVEAIVSFIGFSALIILTIIVTYKDIVRIF